mmetsp:Transcript_11058/g.25314  ORF Transcript_11058/g.25314 Transcript_11058/m.25314 type:complete len:497 (-) Transcript_11058:115-1605(-)|eukprot:CAMPEP_0178410286 /NCGR_PEP_ID=MMETSP0689_2-20121128/20900_1 /TAXON_ID=160604 /ORGANISM="Amphidinium massartii, Strain CS-259" /LENGTH=496 /DNA_ID=CAMNT_0020031455 /DNA_START=68 /DNA_END=1558 /DNA_ORIENTATION=-
MPSAPENGGAAPAPAAQAGAGGGGGADGLGPVAPVGMTIAARQSLKRTYDMFVGNQDVRHDDSSASEMLMRIKMFDEYEHLKDVPDQITDDAMEALPLMPPSIDDKEALPSSITKMLTDGGRTGPGGEQAKALGPMMPLVPVPGRESKDIVQVNRIRTKPQVPKPVWHPPWKLMRVISGHEGWVRTVAVDPTNEWFASSGNDRLIKIWDLASGTLKLSLTGHVSTVRALAISDRHPYLFSASEDVEVKCWDLEQNMAVRNYHGHLNGVYSLALHPTLNILATGGRDATVRIWDMRTKMSIHTFAGHTNAVASLAAQAAEPQFISGSMDRMVRLWDLAAGKCSVTLTNHKDSIRSLSVHPSEYCFASCAADNNKVWKCPRGQFERNIQGHGAIVHGSAIREAPNGSSMLVAGTDNGFLHFWDWRSGYKFQSIETIPQPGSMSSENAIFSVAFDMSGSRLITGECDKTVKIYREDPNATEETHPINWKPPKMVGQGRY